MHAFVQEVVLFLVNSLPDFILCCGDTVSCSRRPFLCRVPDTLRFMGQVRFLVKGSVVSLSLVAVKFCGIDVLLIPWGVREVWFRDLHKSWVRHTWRVGCRSGS